MTVILLYDSLPEELRDQISAGASRCLCPTCGGGSSRELSLDVRQEETGVMRLKCWRSSCDWYGITVTDKNAKIQAKTIKPARPYSSPLYPLSSLLKRILVQAYALRPELWSAHGWRMGESGELVMPVLDNYGSVRGHVTRTFDVPKRCFTFKATSQPWLDHWQADDGGNSPLVVVEDCLSACRLAGCGYDAIALLGTSISIDQAKEIRDVGLGREVYLALDNDAFVKSLKLCDKLRHIVPMTPILLLEDIKTMDSDAEIIGLFNG